jgi:hypothetical protein
MLGSMLARSCSLAAALVMLSGSAPAAECECDHTIALSATSANGSDLGVQPGHVVCVEAGERPFLILENFVGSETAPIIVKNCGGQVRIAHDDRGYGLLINASRHFRVTGTGDPAFEYGFDVSASRTGPDYSGSGVPVGDLSSDYELDHIEVHHTGFAGFILKTESRCDGSANLGAFVQKNTRVHHTYVHDTGGEGFYVGSTGYGGREFDCNGTPTVLYPHEHDGVYLYENRIENTGWDGLQVGVTPKNCEVYANHIANVGTTATDMVQTRGIQIGGASACKIFDNTLIGGPTIGIFVLGAGDTWVANNLIVDFGEDGIYGNDQQLDAISGSSYVFVHNTVVGSGGAGLRLFGDRTQGNAVINNLFVASAEPYGIGGDVDAQEGGNLELETVADAGFEDAANHLYRLKADSVARDMGVVVSGFEVELDHDGVARDELPDVGAFEYTEAPPPPGGASGAGGSAGSGGAGGGAGSQADSGAEDDAGCGCRLIAATPSRDGSIILAALALLALTRRGRRSASSRASHACSKIA